MYCRGHKGQVHVAAITPARGGKVETLYCTVLYYSHYTLLHNTLHITPGVPRPPPHPRVQVRAPHTRQEVPGHIITLVIRILGCDWFSCDLNTGL